MKEYTDWKKQFKQEFGIHFVGSSGELRFAIGFINDLLKEKSNETKKRIIKEFIECKRCLSCGKYKMTDRPDLCDFCYKCLETN